MQFELLQEGPATVCGAKCRTFISAVGAITKDTPGDFATFTRNRDVDGATLVLDSSGGSVLGTLALGRSVRRLGINTTVGRLTKLPGGAGAVRASLSPRADCESMCAYLLLAGKQRYVPSEAQVLVHEIWLGDRREDAAAASYSAEDLVIVQRDIGRLAQYTIEMGGSIDLLETSLRIPPWEPMRRLQQSEIRSMGLDTSASLPNASAEPISVSMSAEPMPRVPPSERGWVVNGKPGQASLRRRHPLTVEGDEIGSFDIILGCGGIGGYDVTYAERRRPAEPLKQVEIVVGRRSIPLKIVSSEIKETELASLARGVMPASLVNTLSRSGSRSLMVTTANGNNVATTIRVGNSGVSQNLPQFAASCAEQPAGRGDAHAELAPAKVVEAGVTGAPK
ncbi:MAG TPA: hypothetical protein VFK79_11890 [Xanthobacteraceae bacterium]|nr:hypothetical protein [Xanthobacteraceae bacterium]